MNALLHFKVALIVQGTAEATANADASSFDQFPNGRLPQLINTIAKTEETRQTYTIAN